MTCCTISAKTCGSSPRRVCLCVIPSAAKDDKSRERASGQAVEDLAPLRQLFVRRGVADAEVRVAVAEDVAGDDQHVLLDRAGDEIRRRLPGRGLREDVEGP